MTNETDDESYLASTVDTFASRIRRKLKDQENKDADAQRKTTVRQAAMLKAMTTVRKSIQEVCKISLDERFSLEVDIADSDGWPKIELWVFDALNPRNKDCCLVISANDRMNLGSIIFSMKNGIGFGKLHLSEENDPQKLPLILKRSLREFLDLASTHVIEQQQKTETDAPVDLILDEEEEIDTIQNALQHQDLFTEDEMPSKQNTVREDSEPSPLNIVPL